MINDAFAGLSVAELISFLHQARTIGLTEKEQNQIPDWQIQNIDNIDKMIKLSGKMGRFLYEVKQLLRLEGVFKEQGNNLNLDEPYLDYLRQKTVDYRSIAHFFAAAELVKGSVKKGSALRLGGSISNVKTQISSTEKYAARGKRLEEVMAFWVKETFLPADMGVRRIEEKGPEQVYQMALGLAYQNGILPQPDKEAKQAGELLADLYKIEIKDENRHLKEIQTLVVDMLRQKHQDIPVSESAEDILPVSVVQSTLQSFSNDQGKSFIQAAHQAKKLMVLNEDIDEVGTKMFVEAGFELVDKESIKKGNSDKTQGVFLENLILSLSMQEISDSNVKMLFAGNTAIVDPSLKDNRDFLDFDSDEGNIKFSAFLTQQVNGTLSWVFALYNKQEKELLLIGDSISDKLTQKFESHSRHYLNRQELSAEKLREKVSNFIDGSAPNFLLTLLVQDKFGIECKDDLGATFSEPNHVSSKGIVLKRVVKQGGR